MDLSAIVRRWWRRQSNLRELDALGSDDLRAIAQDIGVHDSVLYGLISHKGSAEGHLPRLLRTIGLNPDKLSHTKRAVMRDMAIVCAGCTVERHCRRELDHCRAWLHYGQYCPNAATINALRKEQAEASARLLASLGTLECR